MKTRTKLILFGTFCILAAFAILWQLFMPLHLTDAYYIVEKIEAERFAAYVEGDARTPNEQLNMSALRSDSPEDYREIIITANVRNVTLLRMQSNFYEIMESDVYSDRVLLAFENVVPFRIGRLQSETFRFLILVYIADLGDADLDDDGVDALVKGLTIRLQENKRIVGGEISFPTFSHKFELDCAVRDAI